MNILKISLLLITSSVAALAGELVWIALPETPAFQPGDTFVVRNQTTLYKAPGTRVTKVWIVAEVESVRPSTLSIEPAVMNLLRPSSATNKVESPPVRLEKPVSPPTDKKSLRHLSLGEPRLFPKEKPALVHFSFPIGKR